MALRKPSDDIRERCRKFLQDFDFVRLEWDGNEVSAYTKDGWVHGSTGFIWGSPTREGFLDLAEVLFAANLKDYSFKL